MLKNRSINNKIQKNTKADSNDIAKFDQNHMLYEIIMLLGQLKECYINAKNHAKLTEILFIRLVALINNNIDKKDSPSSFKPFSCKDLLLYKTKNRLNNIKPKYGQSLLIQFTLISKINQEIQKQESQQTKSSFQLKYSLISAVNQILNQQKIQTQKKEKLQYLENMINNIYNPLLHQKSYNPSIIETIMEFTKDFLHLKPFFKKNTETIAIIFSYMLSANKLTPAPFLSIPVQILNQAIQNKSKEQKYYQETLSYLKAEIEKIINIFHNKSKITDQIRQIIQNNSSFHQRHTISYQGFNALFEAPIVTIKDLSEIIDKSYNCTHQLIKKFIDNQILEILIKQKRHKIYAFTPYLDIFQN